MFNQLSERFFDIFERLKARGFLKESDILAILRDVRVALLEADVALSVVKSFIEDVRIQATGQAVLKSITPSQMVLKVVYDHLVALLDHPNCAPNFSGPAPVVWMCIGLQGSGKTTLTAKLAHFLTKQERRKILMASVDVYRPAAREQLEILGEQIGVTTLPIEDRLPLDIARHALHKAKVEGFDMLLMDTAGRLHINESLMEELAEIKDCLKPLETLLVADAMTGQDAVKIAGTFHTKIGITGVALSRMDGDVRAGAALSLRSVTGQPLKFLGFGEKLHELEPFQPISVARRILNMGDIVGLIEKAQVVLGQEQIKQATQNLEKGIFTLNDLADQMCQLNKMGGLGFVMNLLPGSKDLKEKALQAFGGEAAIRQKLAIISSMTKQERIKPSILNASRKKRIAQGSGTSVASINRLLKHFDSMTYLMKKAKKGNLKNLLSQGIPKIF